MKLSDYTVLIVLICISCSLFSQQEIIDSTIFVKDTLNVPVDIDSTYQDSLSLNASKDRLPRQSNVGFNFKRSVDAIADPLKYGSKDSSMVDLELKQMHLWGEAYLEYEGYTLNAGYILVDFDTKEATARYLRGANGEYLQKPVFREKSNEVLAQELKFNFETKKGLSYGTRTKESDLEIHGATTKFVTREIDSLSTEQLIFQEDALITTCDKDHPHYGIRTRKLKVIPGKLAIVGVSQLEIAGVPTPLILPFGFFPLVEGRSSGLIFPDDYEYNGELGFGLRNFGYYFPINDYMDVTLLGDIYTRGTHRININTRYKRRYKYNGFVSLEYANNIGEDVYDASRISNKSFEIIVKHNQDSKAHPYRTFGGNINVSTNGHRRTNYTDYDSQVNNILTSSFSYRNSLPGSLFDVSASFTHTQNTITHEMDITLPQVSLNMSTWYPFKNDERIGTKERWYEKINIGYNADLDNFVSTTDTTLFTQQTIDNLVTGVKQSARASASFRALKYFSITPSANFDQILTTKTLRKRLDPTPILDTIGFELDQNLDTILTVKERYNIIDTLEFGFKTYNRFSTGVSASTQIFGTKTWRRGWLRGIRHTMKPQVSINYTTPTDQYYRSVMTSLNPDESETERYNQFSRGAYSASLNELQLRFNYGISHFLEGKYYSKSDKKEKKFQILRQLNMSGNYNYSADSLNWSPLSISANTDLIKGISSLRANATYDFYAQKDGERINSLLIEDQGKLMDFRDLSVTVSNRFTIGNIISNLFSEESSLHRESTETEEDDDLLNDDPLDPLDIEKNSIEKDEMDVDKKIYKQTFIDYLRDFRVRHTYSYALRRLDDRDTSYTSTHTIGIEGSFNLTDNWLLDIDNISYDLVRKRLVYPSIGVRRDLHCWEMRFSWQPAREVYTFFIGVKSSSLNFLKYDYGNRNARALY